MRSVAASFFPSPSAVAEPLPERDEATALELEEDVHDEIRRLRRLGTAELAGCRRADSDIALLLAAAELVAARADADAEGAEARTQPQIGGEQAYRNGRFCNEWWSCRARTRPPWCA